MDTFKTIELNTNELYKINAGCLSFDIGFLIGGAIRTGGHPVEVTKILGDYFLHNTEHKN